ncbi:hypothetical protein ABZ671_18925 [Micromonospora sp. NPDC006766]|uniref:hypothetical protein n=1 Tax=Micromonospora sp. NPDC006766 TaxID=3154778 RepID=UPI0033DC5CCA
MSNLRTLRRRMARANRVDTRPVGVAALYQGRLNAYRCPACRGCTVTVDLDAGVTPAMMGCRATDDCEGTAFSLGYPLPEAWPANVPTQPAWEWYRPGERQLTRLRRKDKDGYDHVVRGGLLLRPYGAGRGPAPADDAGEAEPAAETAGDAR